MKRRVKYLKSAVNAQDYPSAGIPEIALLGRSNSGKSSLINALSFEKVAKVSQQPGKTRTLNFFSVGEAYRIVDMPGYGYSVRSGDEHHNWQGMIESYLSLRADLRVVVLLMDSRRNWTEDEAKIKKISQRLGKVFMVLLTKADQLNQSEKFQLQKWADQQFGEGRAFLTSSKTGLGIRDWEAAVYNYVREFAE
jgi:GTP-binding protein